MRLKRLHDNNQEMSFNDLLVNIPSKMNETGKIVYSDRETEIPPHPVILENENQFWIRYEDTQYCKTANLKECMLCWAFTYAIFELIYPDDLKHSIIFFTQ